MVGSSTAGWAEADGGDPKLNAGESPAGDWSPALLWAAREDPMVSAGSAGTPSAIVASTAAGPPLAAAGVPLAEASSFPPAGVPFGETPPSAVPSDAASSSDAVLARADLAAVGLRGGCLGGAMMPLGHVSWSSIGSSPSIRSSSAAREVTTVGEPPPEPSGLSVRLSKPSSL